tara:strand:- start:4388 stop:5071 length:684 start_codon:yes stop_codon:yes gene_type:complete
MTKEQQNLEQLAELAEDTEKSKIIIMPTPMLPGFGMGGGRATRSVKLFGEVCDEQSEKIIEELISMSLNSEEIVPVNPDDAECKEVERFVHGIDFMISTYGGNADDMFAIYDVMKSVQEETPIHTYGMGKVMSAGVLLLASGTKGERRIGKNCRVMIHHVAGGIAGSLPSMAADLESIEAMESRYVEVLISETSFTKRSLKKLLDKRVNIYLSAEEAIQYGIADKYI